jgi:hypothetical protein
MPSDVNTYETMTSDAFERLAKLLGVPVDLDDPEPALIAAVERRVAELLGSGDVHNKEGSRPCPD